MATEKVGVYRRWLERVPQENGRAVPKNEWPKKRRHSWTVRWYGTTGKRYSKDFKTKRLADRYARDLQDQVKRAKQDRPEKITLHEFIEEHKEIMKGQVAYATLSDQRRAMELFEKFIGEPILLSRITPRHAEAFVAHRLSTVPSVATVNKDIRTLKRVFNLAIEPRGYLLEGENPFGSIKQRKKSQKAVGYISVEEYRLLMEAPDKLWWKAFISMGYGSSLRRNEILNLTWADIDFENQRIHVQSKGLTEHTIEWEPKDHENRLVPMSDEATQLLVDLQAESKVCFPYIFISPERSERIKWRIEKNLWNGKSEIVNNMIKNFDAIRRKAGIAKCTLHDLRRSAITNWAKHLPIQVVQQFSGHSNITTTRKYYITVQADDITSASRIMNEILEGTKND